MNRLQLDGVTKRYGRKTVLSDVSVFFDQGLTLLVGPSGAGKSTLLRLLATAERPSTGRLLWEGRPLPGARRSLRSVLGYAPQAADLPEDLTAREFGLHMAALKGLERRSSDAQFGFIADSLGLGGEIDRMIATFSGGMRRRLILAQALVGEPRLLVLDEPTAELDAGSVDRVKGLVEERARTATIVMTTHLAADMGPVPSTVLHVEGGRVVPR